MRCGLILILILGCAGCSFTGSGEIGDPESARRVHLGLVKELLHTRRYFAALAHLDALPAREQEQPIARLMRGDALRLIGLRDEAEGVYEGLLDSGLAGDAYRGLGLIAAYDGDERLALKYFRHGVQADPLDARLRNGLGWALLLQGQLDDARVHLATAHELDPSDGRAARNMIVWMFLAGRDNDARALGDRIRLDAAEREALSGEARRVAVRIERGSTADDEPAGDILDPVALDTSPADSAESGTPAWLEVQRSNARAGELTPPRADSQAQAYRVYNESFGWPYPLWLEPARTVRSR